jgi:hypothetical protein
VSTDEIRIDVADHKELLGICRHFRETAGIVLLQFVPIVGEALTGFFALAIG